MGVVTTQWQSRGVTGMQTAQVPPVLMRSSQMAKYLNISRSTLHRLTKKSDFPKQAKIGSITLFNVNQVVTYLKEGN